MPEINTTVCAVGPDMRFIVKDFTTYENQEELSVSFAVSQDDRSK
jgi:hypothetical protein